MIYSEGVRRIIWLGEKETGREAASVTHLI